MMTNEDKITVYMMDATICFHFGHVGAQLEPFIFDIWIWVQILMYLSMRRHLDNHKQKRLPQFLVPLQSSWKKKQQTLGLK